MAQQLVASLFQPTTYKGGLPVDSGSNIVVKSATSFANLTGSDVLASGAIVWNKYHGYNHIAMYRSPGTASTALNPTIGGFPIANVVPNTDCGWLPCSLTSKLKVAPALAKNMSMARLSAGALTVYSSTVGTTAAALNGTFSAVNLADLRDLKDWDVAAMMQVGMTDKDKLFGSPQYMGVASIVGPDVRPNLEPVDYSHTRMCGRDGYSQVVSPITTSLTAESVFFISPFYNDSVTTDVYTVKLDILAPFTEYVPSVQAYYPGSTHLAGFTRIKCQLDAAGQPTNFVYEDFAPLVSGSMSTFGTWWTPETSTISPLSPGEFIIGWLFYAASGTTAYQFRVRVPNLYELQNIGSVAVLRWDSLSTNQALTVSADLAIEGIPTGDIATWVKGSITAGFGPPSVFPFLRAVFADPGLPTFARVYMGTGSSVTRTLPDLITSAIHGGDRANLGTVAEAAGFWDWFKDAGSFLFDLGKDIAKQAGPVVLPIAGRAIMGSLGMAAGSRKRLRATDQESQAFAAGMFGA